MEFAFAHRIHASAGDKAHGALLRALFAGALIASMAGVASCGLLDDEDVTMGGVPGANASTAGTRSYYTDTANGLAVYLPYEEVSSYDGMRSTLQEISYTKPTEFYDYFLSIMGSSTSAYGSGGSGSSSEGSGDLSGLSDLIDALSNELATTTEDQAADSAAGGDYATDAYAGSSWFTDPSSDFSYQELPSSLPLVEDGSNCVVEMDDTLWETLAQLFGHYSGSAQRDDPHRRGRVLPAHEPAGRPNGRLRAGVARPRHDGQRSVRPRSVAVNAGDTITTLFDFYDANGIYQETLQGDPIAMRERPRRRIVAPGRSRMSRKTERAPPKRSSFKGLCRPRQRWKEGTLPEGLLKVRPGNRCRSGWPGSWQSCR